MLSVTCSDAEAVKTAVLQAAAAPAITSVEMLKSLEEEESKA
jgi:hypothetical protein